MQTLPEKALVLKSKNIHMNELCIGNDTVKNAGMCNIFNIHLYPIKMLSIRSIFRDETCERSTACILQVRCNLMVRLFRQRRSGCL